MPDVIKFVSTAKTQGFTDDEKQKARNNIGAAPQEHNHDDRYYTEAEIDEKLSNLPSGSGGYNPPVGGIPKEDLSTDVQESLNKADTALQEHQDISNKVDKVSGKGLSTNDYTNDEKTKLSGIANGATANIGTITEIKMNGVSKGASGVVDLGNVLTEHQDISGKADKSEITDIILSETAYDFDNITDPEYMDVQNEIDELKENLNNLAIPINATWESGSIVSFNDVNDLRRIRTNFIEFTHSLTINVKNGYKYCFIKYDESKNGISNTGWTTTTSVKYMVSDDVKYIRLLLAKTSNADILPTSDIYTNISATYFENALEIVNPVVATIHNISWKDGYVNSSGSLSVGTSGGFVYTEEPIHLTKGETITINGKGYNANVAMIATYNPAWTNLVPLVISTDSVVRDYYYTAQEDIDVVLSANKNAGQIVTIKSDIKIKVNKNSNAIESVNLQVENLKKTIGTDYMFMLHDIGIIGDSLSSGEIAYADDDGEHYVDCYEYSWLSNICRKTKATPHYYSEGGMTTKKWLTSEYRTRLESDNAHNAYYIALATNDRNQSYPIGDITDTIGTNSFVGYYKQIIDVVKSKAPNAAIFLVSCYTNSSETYRAYSSMISAIAELYTNCWFIDFANNTEIRNNDGSTNYTNYGHFTTVGYVVVGDTIHRLTNDAIATNLNRNFWKLFAVNN